MRVAHCINDLRDAARRRLPRIVFDYLDGGAGLDTGVQHNVTSFDRLRLMMRPLVGVENIDLSASLFGRTWSLPFGTAPIGLANIVWPGAEETVARAAVEANIPYALATAGTTTLEHIAAVAPDHAWFQLYVSTRDAVVYDLLDRAEAAGYGVLLVTVDVPVSSRRMRDRRNGFALPLRPSLRLAWDLATHPQWLFATARIGAPRLANVVRYAGPNSSAQSLASYMAGQNYARFNWAELSLIRRRWKGRLVVKGLLCPEDAVRARDIGADGIVASNHGGRQLESAVSPIEALPAIRSAVGPEFPVLLDSGIRSGEHIVKALAAGASFVLVGRAAMYGIGAGGAVGIRAAIGILRDEISCTAAHLGVRSISELSTSHIWQS